MDPELTFPTATKLRTPGIAAWRLQRSPPKLDAPLGREEERGEETPTEHGDKRKSLCVVQKLYLSSSIFYHTNSGYVKHDFRMISA